MGPEIRYTAPTTPGECGFTINGQKILLRAIVGAYVNPPTITSPVNNSLDKGPDVTITTSSFQTTGGIDNHLSTDYHIAEDPLFETGFVTYSNQITGKTSFTISSLQAAKTYYVRARHRGEALSVSGWSPVVIFITKVEYKPNKPFISSPLNAQEGLGPSLTATSSAYSLAESSQSTLIDVEWQLSKSNTFSPLIGSSSESGLNAVWNNIDYASTYYLRMRHSSNIGTVPSEWSDVISFMSGAIPNPNTPTITAPVGQQDIDLTLVADAFHSDGGEIHASSTWQISTDSNFATILTTKSVTDSTIFLTTYTVTGLNTASAYYARVSYKSDQGRSSTFSAPVTFNTLGVLVNTPSISFVNGTDPYLNALASLYTANASAGGVSKIHWQVYTTSDFTSGVIYDQEDSYNGTGNPSLTGIYLPPETVLYFRMRYKSANGFYSDYSNVLASTSKTYLTTPTLNTATVTETTGVFSWNRGNNTIPDVTTTYRFTISATPDFSSGTANINTSAATLNATLVYGTTYYWKIEQTDTLVSVGYTEVKTSTTGTVSVGAQPAVVYTVTSSSDTYNEGESAVFVLTKSREDTSGDFLTFSGSAGNAADINYPLENTLTFGTGNNAQLIVTVPLLADNFTDGDKTLTANWRTGSNTGPIVASKTITVVDVSLSPVIQPSVQQPTLTFTHNTGPNLSILATDYSANAEAGVLETVIWQWSSDGTFAVVNGEHRIDSTGSTGHNFNNTNYRVLNNIYLPPGTTIYIRVIYISASATNAVSNFISASIASDAYITAGTITNPPNGTINFPLAGAIEIPISTTQFKFFPGYQSTTFLNVWDASFNENSAQEWIMSPLVENPGTIISSLNLDYDTLYNARIRTVAQADFFSGNAIVSAQSPITTFRTKPAVAYSVGLAVIDTQVNTAGNNWVVTGHFVKQNPEDVLHTLSYPDSDTQVKFLFCSPGAPASVIDPILNPVNTYVWGNHRDTMPNTMVNMVNYFGPDAYHYFNQLYLAMVNNGFNPGGVPYAGLLYPDGVFIVEVVSTPPSDPLNPLDSTV
jgi:hypothetical protein